MTALKDLKRDLERALGAKQDFDQIALIRQKIAEAHGDTVEGAEANYKLGLDALFRRGDLELAAQHLREATRVKAPPWSVAARVSLGLILLRQGKDQQAVFELRRVAGATPPTLVSAQAWGLLVIAFRQLKKGQDANKAQTEYRKALEQIERSGAPADVAQARYMLGMEHKFDGNRAMAKRYLEQALGFAELPAEDRVRIEATLAGL